MQTKVLSINIVQSILFRQYYVNINPKKFVKSRAVNRSRKIHLSNLHVDTLFAFDSNNSWVRLYDSSIANFSGIWRICSDGSIIRFLCIDYRIRVAEREIKAGSFGGAREQSCQLKTYRDKARKTPLVTSLPIYHRIILLQYLQILSLKLVCE